MVDDVKNYDNRCGLNYVNKTNKTASVSIGGINRSPAIDVIGLSMRIDHRVTRHRSFVNKAILGKRRLNHILKEVIDHLM